MITRSSIKGPPNSDHEPVIRGGTPPSDLESTGLEHGDPGPAAERGLLTVADVTGLDLAATELVVLSACDTGGGVITCRLLDQGHGPAEALPTVRRERHVAGDPVLSRGAFVCRLGAADGAVGD
ncbi:CHAT domain-containing protein [Streptomyces sp. NPDC004658]|uniref:CHAT domain-containing protein n=1 Tax=Streptomyces sp. NPDC004658 TaxID=3154672 RepID=UPI0033AF249B